MRRIHSRAALSHNVYRNCNELCDQYRSDPPNSHGPFPLSNNYRATLRRLWRLEDNPGFREVDRVVERIRGIFYDQASFDAIKAAVKAAMHAEWQREIKNYDVDISVKISMKA
jgi:hypothetical protein